MTESFKANTEDTDIKEFDDRSQLAAFLTIIHWIWICNDGTYYFKALKISLHSIES